MPAGAVLHQADRDSDDALSDVARMEWDAVIDVSRLPAHVRRAVRDLRGTAGRYVFVSSASAYASQAELGQDEDAPLLAPREPESVESAEDYGAAKSLCEQLVLEGFGESNALIARAGLIGGPGDHTDRTGYWPWRFANPSTPDQAVLVPEVPDLPTSVIDVRDLSQWLVAAAAEGTSGVFNTVGHSIPFAEHIATAREVAGHTGPLVEAPEDWLLAQGVGEWSGSRSLPLWLADPDWHGMNARSNERALAAGLDLRPLASTLEDTLRWEQTRPTSVDRKAGLSDEAECDLIDRLRA